MDTFIIRHDPSHRVHPACAIFVDRDGVGDGVNGHPQETLITPASAKAEFHMTHGAVANEGPRV